MRKQIAARILATAVVIFTAVSSNWAQGSLGKAQQVTGDRFGFASRTRAGANIYSVRQPSTAMLTAHRSVFSHYFPTERKVKFVTVR